MIFPQFISFFLILALCFLEYACVPLNAAHGEKTAAPVARASSHSADASSKPGSDLERLALLRKIRVENLKATDYPVGPGDVLEISVPGVPELTQSAVRISAEGAIALPYIGILKAAGLTERQLREEIRLRLEKNTMHDPQINLHVREYRSRQVAILGAVQKPGLYSLSSGSETLLDALSLAGGTTPEAAPRIHFIPAEPMAEEDAKKIIGSLPAAVGEQSLSPFVLKSLDPILIDFTNPATTGNQIYLTLPARPGDVIIVPGSGEVLVEGWVEKAGSYKITPGLTIIGALAAAGGSQFAADTGAVRVVRTTRTGEKISLLADVEGIKRGEQPDIPVMEGDVIEVRSSTPKLVAYGFYHLFSTMIRIGASVPLVR